MRIVLLAGWMAFVLGCSTGVGDPNAGRESLSARARCQDLNLREVHIDTIFSALVSQAEGEHVVTLRFDSALPQCAPEEMDDCVATTGQSRDQCAAECLGCIAAVAAELLSR